jgi:hypothetical protein
MILMRGSGLESLHIIVIHNLYSHHYVQLKALYILPTSFMAIH